MALLVAVPLHGQVLAGRVLDDTSELPVPGARIALVDASGDRALEVEADSLGRYRFTVPRPAAFTIETTRLGYEPGRTPLLDLGFEGTRTLDLLVHPEPIALKGFEVTVSSEEEMERALRHFGVAPGDVALTRLVTPQEIEAVLGATRDFGDVLNRQNIAGLEVNRGIMDEVTCIRVRVRAGCATIVIDGAVAPIERAAVLSAEAWESMVILLPYQASLLFGSGAEGGGAVLLFSRGRAWR